MMNLLQLRNQLLTYSLSSFIPILLASLVFLINYSGHGGELGWSKERILEVGQINKWENENNLPLFVTATCEFSRFDDPARTSAGEYAFLNKNGGAIALGHPLGCTGAKLTVQLINEMKKRNQKYGMVTMCVGAGQGAAGVFEIL